VTATVGSAPTRRSWPIFSSLAGYDRRWLRGDLIAGLTVWAVLVPEALAYASIAGVSPVVGLYAAPPALVLYAAFGSSRHLVVGPMSATAALSAAAVADLTTGGPDDILAFTGVLAIVTGVLALAAGLVRLGVLANSSPPVLKGFIIGLALTIIIGQVPKLFGIEKSDGDFFEQAAGGVMLVGFADGLGAAKTYATRAHYEVDPNRELIGLDAANIVSGMMTGMAVNGSLSKTAVNGSAGARSQVSGLVVAAFTVVTLLFLTGLFEDLPEATLAAVVIAAGAVAALVGVLVFDTLPGLVIGIIVSLLLLLLYRASRPNVAELGGVPGALGRYGDVDGHPENQAERDVAVLRVESGLTSEGASEVAVHRTIDEAIAAARETPVPQAG
jgi:MFS superfamily sulfate permease-like transporter